MEQKRVLSYDIFRGILIIMMIFFHILINFPILKFNELFFYWVPMGFMMFLGIVLGRFLQNKKKKKMIIALKLLVVFVLFNIPHVLTGKVPIISLLQGDQSILSFEILFPMSLVIASTILLDKVKKYWKILLITSLFLLLLRDFSGFYSYNLLFFMYGLIGYFLACGVDLHASVHASNNPKHIILLIFMAVIPFMLIPLTRFFDFIVIFQVLALYCLSAIFIKKSTILSFIGKYSFLIYVGHILLIRGIVTLLK